MIFLLQLLVVLALILLNGFFVASEISLVSLRRTRIAELVKRGDKHAPLVADALNKLDNFISATQLGITIASIGLGWIGEPTIAHALGGAFTFLPRNIALLSAHTIAIILAFALITFFHIVLGELVPKTFALQNVERMSLWLILPLTIFTKVFHPFVVLLKLSSQFILRLLGQTEKITQNRPISEEELGLMLMQSAGTGSIEKEEARMVQKLFNMDDLPIKHVMIHKSNITAFPITMTIEEATNQLGKHTYSRFPIYEKSIDDIVGFVHIKDIYKLEDEGKGKWSFGSIHLRKIIRVKENTKIDDVLEEMKSERVHMAIVSEDGKTAGIVTLENIVESVMGDIRDEFDQSAS